MLTQMPFKSMSVLVSRWRRYRNISLSIRLKSQFNNLPLKKWLSITKSSIKRNAYVDSWRLAKENVNSSSL